MSVFRATRGHSKVKVNYLKNYLKTDEVINDMKNSIKRNLDVQLEIQRKTRQTLQGKFPNSDTGFQFTVS